MNLFAIFFTGLTTGGLTCLAMQGGLLTSVIANQKKAALENEDKSLKTFDTLDWLPVVLFLISKLVVHTFLGALLGWLGSRLELSLEIRLIFQTVAALFMLATAANLLELHPVFRYAIFQPPRFLHRFVREQSKGSAFFTPVILGALTLFIPCGVTQAIELVAVTSGNPLVGAAIMFSFVLGTSPLFALIGIGTARLSEKLQQPFLKAAAALLIILAISSFNGVLTVIDSPITLQKITRPITYFFSEERFDYGNSTSATVNGVQKVKISVTGRGYTPSYIKIKKDIPVELTVETNNVYSCASHFTLKAFNLRAQLQPTDSKTFSFTPTQTGKYEFTCSMGMYVGTLEVI